MLDEVLKWVSLAIPCATAKKKSSFLYPAHILADYLKIRISGILHKHITSKPLKVQEVHHLFMSSQLNCVDGETNRQTYIQFRQI